MLKIDRTGAELDITGSVAWYKPLTDRILFDSDRLEILNSIIYNDLDSIERNLVILFLRSDCNLRKTAEILSVSVPTLAKRINGIKKRIRECFGTYL